MPLLLKTAIWLSYLFLFSELVLLFKRHSGSKTAVKQNDRGSLILLWVTIALGLTAGFSLAKYSYWHLINFVSASAGMIMIIGGLAIRWTSIIQLNKAFTVNVAVNRDHALKTDGIYSVIRHPSYSGLLLFMTGEALAMNTLASMAAVILPVGIAIHYRIHVEEKLLEGEFGDEYRNYRKITRRLIPYLY